MTDLAMIPTGKLKLYAVFRYFSSENSLRFCEYLLALCVTLSIAIFLGGGNVDLFVTWYMRVGACCYLVHVVIVVGLGPR